MTTEFPTIITEKLLLRRFMDNDLENVFKGLSHPDVIKYYGVSYNNMQEAKKQLDFFVGLEKN